MLFNFFRRKAQKTESEPEFPFFRSQQELPGDQALPLLNEVEAELVSLAEQAKIRELNAQEQLRQKTLAEQYRDLLGSGQVASGLATHLVVSSGQTAAMDPEMASDWFENRPTAHILLIEDDYDLSEMLAFCLDRVASTVSRIHDGDAAVQWIDNHEPVDLISLDLMLPRKDGLQLLKYIRAQSGWADVPLLVVSSKSDEATVQKVLQAGADVYLTKPIQPDAYLAQVQKLLDRA